MTETPVEVPEALFARLREHFAEAQLVELTAAIACSLYVGNCGLHDIDPVGLHATLGIVIGRKDRWGQGFGTETVRLLCRHAFDDLNLHKVCLSCYATNERGLRLYARAGFTPE